MASNAENVSIWWRHHDTIENTLDSYITVIIVSIATNLRF